MSALPPLLFYCQHSVGLGHLVRSYALCGELAREFRVVLLCGGVLPQGIDPPAGVEVVPLPALGVGSDGRFTSHDPRFTLERAWQRRRKLIMSTFEAVAPRAVVVELFPFGRSKFAREIVPLLDAARASGAVTACSLRDILVSRRRDQRSHDARACERANRHFDAVLVHCDPRFARLEETFPLRGRLEVPVRYTGFAVAPDELGWSPPADAPRGPVVVSAGGGRVGEPLLRATIDAQRLLWRSTGLRMRVIAGPLLPEAAWLSLRARADAAPGLELVRSVVSLAGELRTASASVSQCGYNTALEVVRAGVPALVVPFATPEEDEQTRRARRLERLGALRVLAPEALDAARLADGIRGLLDFRPARAALDLDGLRATRLALRELVGSRSSAEAEVSAA